MVNVKLPHLADLEIESMKNSLIILEKQLEVIGDEDGREYAEISELD